MKRLVICILLCVVEIVGVAAVCLTDSEGETDAAVSVIDDQRNQIAYDEQELVSSVDMDVILMMLASKEAAQAPVSETEADTENATEDTKSSNAEATTEVEAEPEVEADSETAPVEVEEDSDTATSSSKYYDEIPLSAELQAVVFDSASTYGVSAALILAMIETESSFDPYAVSSSGCYGLMQLNPSSFGSGLSPTQNIKTGTKYIAELISKYGDTQMALVAYNCGESGAQSNYFSQGLYSSSYSRTVVSRQSSWLAIVGW